MHIIPHTRASRALGSKGATVALLGFSPTKSPCDEFIVTNLQSPPTTTTGTTSHPHGVVVASPTAMPAHESMQLLSAALHASAAAGAPKPAVMVPATKPAAA
jgi:hypothetical protein